MTQQSKMEPIDVAVSNSHLTCQALGQFNLSNRDKSFKVSQR